MKHSLTVIAALGVLTLCAQVRAQAPTKQESEETVRESQEKAKQVATDVLQQGRAQAQKILDNPQSEEAQSKAVDLLNEAQRALQGKAPVEEPAEAATEAASKIAKAAQRAAKSGPGAAAVEALQQASRVRAWRQISQKIARPSEVPPPVRQELRTHAQRVAQLRRIIALATTASDTESVRRATELLRREGARHARQMTELLGAPYRPSALPGLPAALSPGGTP